MPDTTISSPGPSSDGRAPRDDGSNPAEASVGPADDISASSRDPMAHQRSDAEVQGQMSAESADRRRNGDERLEGDASTPSGRRGPTKTNRRTSAQGHEGEDKRPSIIFPWTAIPPPAKEQNRSYTHSRSTPASPRHSIDHFTHIDSLNAVNATNGGRRTGRRKSHGAYYSVASSGAGAASPPASPVTSYAYASGHSISPRRLPGQLIASPRASRDDGDRRPSLSQSQSEPEPASLLAQAITEHASAPALSAPTFGPHMCDQGDQGEKVTPQDRHYIARMLANLELQHELSALSSIGTLAGYGAPFLPHANGPNSRPATTLPATKSSSGSSRFFSLLSSSSSSKTLARDPQFVGYLWDPSSITPSPLCAYLFSRFVHDMPGLRGAKKEYWTEHVQPFFDTFAERDLSSTVERGEITKRRLLSMGLVRLLGTYTSSALPAVPGPAAPAKPSDGMMRLLDVLVGGGGSMDALARAVLGEHAGAGHYNAWVGVLQHDADDKEPIYHVLTQPLATPHPLVQIVAPLSAFLDLQDSLRNIDPHGKLALPALPVCKEATAQRSRSESRPTAREVQTWLRWVVLALSHPALAGRSPNDEDLLKLARAALEKFLLSMPPTGQDTNGVDAATLCRRIEIDDAHSEEAAEEWARAGKRAKALRTTWIRYRRALIQGHELDETMRHVKRCSTVQKLPKEYQDAEEWALIYVAQALHYIFVGASTGPEVLNILRSFHELIPYGAIKLGLNLINPTLAIRAIVQLVLGQPAGQLSLFQRIWSHVCNSANKHQRALIKQFRGKLGNDALCHTLKAHVADGYVARQKTKQAAIEQDEDIVLTIVRERGSREDHALVETWYRAFADAGDDPTASAEAGSFADLKELLAAYYRYRDREQVLAIALEPNTPRLLHATIAVFYSTIHAVANASKLSDRVGDLQAFLDDLVQVAAKSGEPYEFIRLAKKHHQALYYFVHELAAKGGDLLDPILGWAQDGLAFLRDGARAGGSDARVGAEVDTLLARAEADQASAVLGEARAFARWTALRKAQQDLELRVDLILAARADAQDETPTGKRARNPHSTHHEEDDTQLDKARLWSRFLAFLPLGPEVRTAFAEAANKQRLELHRTGPGGDLEWAAWWAERETAGAAGKDGIVVAQQESARETARSPAASAGTALPTALAATQDRSKSKIASTGKSKAKTRSDEPASGQDGPFEAELAVPPPSSETTRSLLAGYVEQLDQVLRRRRK